MPANQLRGTPGLLLLGMAVAMIVIAARGWIIRSGAQAVDAQPPAAEQAK